jgi:hypothetical protein
VGTVPRSVKGWADAVDEDKRSVEAADKEMAKADQWYVTTGRAIYEKTAKKEHEAVDQKLAEMKNRREVWVRIERATLPVVAEEYKERSKAVEERKRLNLERAPRERQDNSRGH